MMGVLFPPPALEFPLPVNNSLIDYPVKRYDRAFELASDVINENFTARKSLNLGQANAKFLQ
jgi:hypothetical protein